MKTDIHPEYVDSVIRCACGRETPTRAAVPEVHVEICSHCHPFFTGKQKLVDTAGRVERFLSKYGREDEAEEMAAEVEQRSDGEKLEMPEDMQLPESEPKRDEDEEGEEAAGDEAGEGAEIEGSSGGDEAAAERKESGARTE